MQTKKYLLLSLLLLLSCYFFTAPVHAGWIMENNDGSTTYIDKGKIKSEYASDGMDFSHIIDANKGLITMVDKNRKIYGTGTPAEYCKATKTFANEIQEQMLAGLPPEQRRMMKEQMKQFQQMPKSAPMESLLYQ